MAAADAGVEAAERGAETGRLRIRIEVRAAFAAWWAATSSHAALGEHAARLATLAERASARAAAGEESGFVARRLAAESAQAGADAAAALADAMRARAELIGWTGGVPAGAVPSAPPLPDTPGTADAGVCADLAMLAAEVRRREHEAELAGTVFRFPELSAGWQQVEQAGATHSGLLAFSLGEADVTDTLDTLRSAVGMRVRAVEARARAPTAHRALEIACGRELALGGER